MGEIHNYPTLYKNRWEKLGKKIEMEVMGYQSKHKAQSEHRRGYIKDSGLAEKERVGKFIRV